MLFIILLVSFAGFAWPKCQDTVQHGFRCRTQSKAALAQSWGAYSPYFSVPSDISDEVPQGCNITFVNLLSRHGARFPTTSKTAAYAALINQIHTQTTSYSAQYSFIKSYNYTLGANDLTTFGQMEMQQSGIKFYDRYQTLTKSITPFFRSASDTRVVESAQNFSQGFHSARLNNKKRDPTYPYPIEIILEAAGSNNTLSHDLCTVFETDDSQINTNAENTWTAQWVGPVLSRVNDNLKGANLTSSQLILFMDLCPFNTVASTQGIISPFCNLFTQKEWDNYGYYRTLDKWYGYSNGNPLGPTQGVGFAAELLARMTGDRSFVTNPESYTSINHTLDGSQSTFPLGSDYPLFCDFSHDNDLSSIFAALGLYNSTSQLSNTTLETTAQTNGYSASWTIPFGARAYFEKMVCQDTPEELVRAVINDRVVPLENCGTDSLGRCTLSDFVASQSFVTNGGLWNQCFP